VPVFAYTNKRPAMQFASTLGAARGRVKPADEFSARCRARRYPLADITPRSPPSRGGAEGKRSAGFDAVSIAASVVLMASLVLAAWVVFGTAAQAQDVGSTSCLGDWTSFSCVTRWGPASDPYIRLVPPPADAAATARALRRERGWADRCRPYIRQDRYGVARYHYAAPGCEFGVGEY
jgi:hypothetical protein